jgi:CzcA family heavy metal efflux pump
VKVAHWASRHARSILFLLTALVVGGIFGTLALPVSLFPHVSFPRIRIDFDAGDRPAQRMMTQVTRPAEETLRSIPGVSTIQSTTSRGSAEVTLVFDWGQDMAVALLQAEAQINRILPSLPAGTTFEIRRMDPTVFPVIAYSITSKTRSLTELHDLAEYQLRPVLSTVSGVAKIGVDGGATAEYRVTVDPAKLRAHGLALSDISSALSAANVLTAVGHVEENYRLYLVVIDTSFKSIEQIGATVLRGTSGGVTLVSDVAAVSREQSPQYIRSTADGRDAVLLNVYQQPAGNTVNIAAGIRRTLEEEKKRIPSDVQITRWYDQSDLITASAASVRDAVLIGVGLAALVLLLFLRNFRMTLIATLAVPAVLAITALLLYLLNQSFNIMTLGGMAAAVGLIIDDAIVMSEHIVRRLHAPENKDADPTATVLSATEEFTKPLTGSSLSTIIIHIPPAFLVGVFGAFFGSLSLSMAISLVVSYLVAWLVIPIIAAHWLEKRDVHQEQPGTIARGALSSYAWLMRKVLPIPWIVPLIMVPALIYGYFEFQHVESGLMPTIDEGGFVIDYVGPPGASLTEMDRLLQKVEAILSQIPEVQAYSRRTGFSLGGDISESNTGDFFVQLKQFPRRPIEEVMEDVSKQVHQSIPGFDQFEPAQLMEDLLGDLTGKPQPIVVNIYCDDESTLMDFDDKVVNALPKIDGVEDIDPNINLAGDALDVQVDRVKASLEGVDPNTLNNDLQDLLSGKVTTQVQEGEKILDVRLWIPADIRRSQDDLGNMLLKAPDGHFFPLKRVANFQIISGQPEITRDQMKRVVSVTARSKRDLGSTIADVKKMMDQPGFVPSGVRYTLGGQYEQQQIAFRGLIKVIAAAAALVFLLLLLMYESMRVATAIMLTTLLAIAAVFVGLRWTGTQLNISSLMGMVMIVGNVTEVAIFYYSEYAEFPAQGSIIDRLISAGNNRMRAITMTSVAAILALLPLALNIGRGSAMLQPLAIAIITGLIVQLPLVLIVLPVLLALFDTAEPDKV